jgi:DNA segregation ATPase FtsK/SpoIIIE-like protein
VAWFAIGGIELYGQAVVPVVPLGFPEAPSIVAVEPADGAVVLTIEAPADDGGSQVTGYQVVVQPAEPQITGLQCSEAGNLRVGGLRNGVEYSFGVVAESAVGESAVSDMTPPVVPAVGLFAYEHDFDEQGVLFHLGSSTPSSTATESRRYGWINPSSTRLGPGRVRVSSSDTIVQLRDSILDYSTQDETGEQEEQEEQERRMALAAVTSRSSTMLHLWTPGAVDGEGCTDECNWVMLDLGQRRRLLPTRYKLRYALTPTAGSGWVLEGSTDGQEWWMLHHRLLQPHECSIDGGSTTSDAQPVSLSKVLTGSWACGIGVDCTLDDTHELRQGCEKGFRFLRLRQTSGSSSPPSSWLAVGSIELYGAAVLPTLQLRDNADAALLTDAMAAYWGDPVAVAPAPAPATAGQSVASLVQPVLTKRNLIEFLRTMHTATDGPALAKRAESDLSSLGQKEVLSRLVKQYGKATVDGALVLVEGAIQDPVVTKEHLADFYAFYDQSRVSDVELILRSYPQPKLFRLLKDKYADLPLLIPRTAALAAEAEATERAQAEAKERAQAQEEADAEARVRAAEEQAQEEQAQEVAQAQAEAEAEAAWKVAEAKARTAERAAVEAEVKAAEVAKADGEAKAIEEAEAQATAEAEEAKATAQAEEAARNGKEAEEAAQEEAAKKEAAEAKARGEAQQGEEKAKQEAEEKARQEVEEAEERAKEEEREETQAAKEEAEKEEQAKKEKKEAKERSEKEEAEKEEEQAKKEEEAEEQAKKEQQEMEEQTKKEEEQAAAAAAAAAASTAEENAEAEDVNETPPSPRVLGVEPADGGAAVLVGGTIVGTSYCIIGRPTAAEAEDDDVVVMAEGGEGGSAVVNIRGLRNGVEYSFGVVAESAVGESAVSDMTPPVVPLEEYGDGTVVAITAEELTAFMQRHNPAKVPNVAQILNAFAGRDAELLQMLQAKYGEIVPRETVTVDRTEEKLLRKCRTMFDEMDMDQDGALTVADLEGYYSSKGVDVGSEKGRAMIQQQFHSVATGGGDRISFDDFVRKQLPVMRAKLQERRGKRAQDSKGEAKDEAKDKAVLAVPTVTAEALMQFYSEHDPSKASAAKIEQILNKLSQPDLIHALQVQ